MKKISNKAFMLILKYAPVVYATGVFVGAILSLFEIYLITLSISFGSSLCSNVIMHSTSCIFKYCKWHRILIYYIYGFIGIISVDYFIPTIEIYLIYADVITIVSIIVFIIAYLNRNKN